jgi:hypothetical protein
MYTFCSCFASAPLDGFYLVDKTDFNGPRRTAEARKAGSETTTRRSASCEVLKRCCSLVPMQQHGKISRLRLALGRKPSWRSLSREAVKHEYIQGYCPVLCTTLVNMASTQATSQTQAAGRPSTSGSSSVAPEPSFTERYLGLVHSSFLDGPYYVKLLGGFLNTQHPALWASIACISFSAVSIERNVDWLSPTSGDSRLCILRGCISPSHLSELAYRFRLSPAFLVGHLGTAITMSPTKGAFNWPICPPLPSQRSNVGHVRFLTLGCNARSTNRFDFSRMPQRRKLCRQSIQHLDWQLQLRNQFGETRLRDVHLHNPQYFSVEQVVSFCFVRDDQNHTWVGEWLLLTTCVRC